MKRHVYCEWRFCYICSMQPPLEVAIFGMGDQSGYADNYCDAMDELASCFEKQGATIVGAWSSEGYEHEDSKSRIAASGPRLL